MQRGIKPELLARWAQICADFQKLHAHLHISVCLWVEPKGIEIRMIGPEGDRAWLLMPFDEIALRDPEPTTMQQILRELKKSLRIHGNIIIPPAGTVFA